MIDTTAIDSALAIILTTVATAVGGLLSAALWKLRVKWGLDGTAQDKLNMEAEIKSALDFGVSQATTAIQQKGWDHADTHSDILNNAVHYFVQRFPDRTATIADAAQPKDSSITVSPTAAVLDTLSARLPAVVTEAAASPATPPVPLQMIGTKL